IKRLAELAHEARALFHTDAVQAAGKIPVDLTDWDVDYATLSGHKVYAPKGVGALYVKKGTPLTPFIRGGHQENGLRAGTYNTPAITAFGLACELAKTGLQSYMTHTATLKNALQAGLEKTIPNIKINGHPQKNLPNTLNVSFPGAEGESLLLYLDLKGISVSTGSACASGNLDPSHVLLATGLGPEAAHGSIRFSFGKYNTMEEVDYIIKELPPIVDRLRKMSTI
ncbi:MAG: cysteine desulfurase family protein, partial [Treponemataceae bacterium]